MNRTGFKPRQRAMARSGAKDRPKAPKPLLAKATGRRLVPKDEAPIYDEKHLALVRAQPCIVSGVIGVVAHHARGLFLRTAGRRITDFLTVPLRPDLHDGYGHSLHRHGNEIEWWQYSGMPQAKVFDWIRTFLLEHYERSHPGVAQAFAKMAAEEARVTVTETAQKIGGVTVVREGR